jgi:hypothetical protein
MLTERAHGAFRRDRFWPIPTIPGSIVRAAIGGNRAHPAKSGRQPPMRRSARSQGVAVLLIGARRGPRHHSATAKQ